MHISITTFWTLDCIYRKPVLASSMWYDNIVTNLKQDTAMNHLRLMYKKNFNNNDIYRLGGNISREIPTHIANFKNIMKGTSQRLKLLPYLMKTAELVIIATENEYRNLSTILNLFDSVSNLPEVKKRPKVLIAIQFANSRKHREFFQLMWHKLFSDITILEIEHREVNKSMC